MAQSHRSTIQFVIHSTGLVMVQNMFFVTQRGENISRQEDQRSREPGTDWTGFGGESARGRVDGCVWFVLWKYFVSNARVVGECVGLERPRFFDWSAGLSVDKDNEKQRVEVTVTPAHVGAACEVFVSCPRFPFDKADLCPGFKLVAFVSTIKFTTYCYSYDVRLDIVPSLCFYGNCIAFERFECNFLINWIIIWQFMWKGWYLRERWTEDSIYLYSLLVEIKDNC